MAARLVEGCARLGHSFTSASAMGQSGVGAPQLPGVQRDPPRGGRESQVPSQARWEGKFWENRLL